MRREQARELLAGGWHWVGSHTLDCRSRGCDPHPTKESAQDCQYEYELSQYQERTFSSAEECVECRSMRTCEVCHEWTDEDYNSLGRCNACSSHPVDNPRPTDKVWTDKALMMGGYIGRLVFLCDAHRTHDVLRKHTSPPEVRWVS